MRLVKKIITLICIIAISLSCLVVPASAVDVGGMGDLVSGVADFGQWAIDSSLYGIKLVARIFDEDVCPERPGGVNTTHSFVVNTTTKDGVLADWYVCEYCGFNSGYKADSESLSAAYDDYVSTLPTTGYDSSGKLIWQPTASDAYGYYRFAGTSGTYSTSHSGYPGLPPDCSFSGTKIVWNHSIGSYRFCFDIGLWVPVSGNYGLLPTQRFSIRSVGTDGSIINSSCNYVSGSYRHFVEGGQIEAPCSIYEIEGRPSLSSSVITVSFPVYEVIPDTAPSGDTYSTTTRPTSITGGNYGIVGDNGQITKVEDNSTIVNETNNTYYNPATGATVPITGWTYDYSDRSYKVTLESGDTVTVTYGDENITIQEGDTVYNVYYLIDGSSPENPPCEHDWQKGDATVPTCVRPGSASYVCSKCQQTKTETIPALGHDWQVKQSVTTEYDDTGQLVQEGYTIFECSRCHEQYKSPDGTIPPGGGSGTDPGEEDDGTTIGGLIEKLLSGVGSIVGGIIKGLLSLLTKAVEALAGLAELFTTFVGSLVELWGGFTSFLSAVFPFLPEEFVVIIELGLILMIAAAVFRKFIS